MMIDPKLIESYPLEVICELEKVLVEIGEIQPVWDNECGEFVASHPEYASIDAPGDTVEEAIQTFHRLLCQFLQERINNNLAPHVERMTSGRGGKRPGSGRPKSSPTTTIRLPSEIANWLKDNSHLDQVRNLMMA